MLRDDMLSYTSGTRARKKILHEILAHEESELGVSRLMTPDVEHERAQHQHSYAERIAQPVRPASHTYTDYLRAPRTLRGKGSRSLDVLFSPNTDGTFWLYGSQKLSQATLGTALHAKTRDDIKKSIIGTAIKRQMDSLMAIAATKQRCGLIFDLVSTSKIITTGVPHEVGAYIYDYIDEVHYDKTGLKFVFVGITDNVNCCAARDVFCRDDIVSGQYVGDTKRPFDALDNVHMYTVFPGHRLHPFSRGRESSSGAESSAADTSGGGDLSRISTSVSRAGTATTQLHDSHNESTSMKSKRLGDTSVDVSRNHNRSIHGGGGGGRPVSQQTQRTSSQHQPRRSAGSVHRGAEGPSPTFLTQQQ